MGEIKITRIVRYVEMDGKAGFAIMDTDGELEVFYPAPLHYISDGGSPDKLTVSADFFRYLAALQDHGVTIKFDL